MRYALDPTMPVLQRPDGAVQIGWDPSRAVLVRPLAGLTPGGLGVLLRAMRAPMPAEGVRRLANTHGLSDGAAVDGLLRDLAAAGVLRREDDGRREERALSVRVHGGGPLSELLAEGLRCSGSRVGQTSHSNAGAVDGVDLVVLADALTPDPRLVRDLHGSGVPHMPVRVRDGVGVVGPLVIPGRTSCLTCADLYRSDRDPAWPAMAAQLRDVVGTADRATLLATAALALSQVQQIIAAVRGSSSVSGVLATLDATLEVDVDSPAIRARRWVRHPLCGCWPGMAAAPPEPQPRPGVSVPPGVSVARTTNTVARLRATTAGAQGPDALFRHD